MHLHWKYAIIGLVVGVGLFCLGWRIQSEEQLPSATNLARDYTQKFDVSAYCPDSCCCGIYADGITASGHVIQQGDKFVAAPPKYPFGTMMDIPGYGTVPVLDRGGAIKGNKLDAYFDSHKDALIWGRKQLQVTVYNKRQKP